MKTKMKSMKFFLRSIDRKELPPIIPSNNCRSVLPYANNPQQAQALGPYALMKWCRIYVSRIGMKVGPDEVPTSGMQE